MRRISFKDLMIGQVFFDSLLGEEFIKRSETQAQRFSKDVGESYYDFDPKCKVEFNIN